MNDAGFDPIDFVGPDAQFDHNGSSPVQAHDRPEEVPQFTNAGDPEEQRRREELQREQARLLANFVRNTLADPVGRRFVWGLLAQSGAFEAKFGFGPQGHPNPEAHWYYAGQRDFGQRLYLQLSAIDRAGMLSLHDEFDGRFAKPGGRTNG